MGPTRKKARTTPPSVEEPSKASSEASTSALTKSIIITDGQDHAANITDSAPSPLKGPSPNSESISANEVKPRGSWYGTWPRKSVPSTSVARETILADKPTNGPSIPDLSRFEPKKAHLTASRPPSMYLGKGKETLDVTMGGTLEEEDESRTKSAPKQDQPTPADTVIGNQASPREESTEVPRDLLIERPLAASEVIDTLLPPPASPSGWLGGWLSRAPMQPLEKPLNAPEEPKIPDPPASIELEQEPKTPRLQVPQATLAHAPPKDTVKVAEAPKTSSSWFGLWSTAAPSTVTEAPSEPVLVKTEGEPQDTVIEDTPAPEQFPPKAAPPAGSSWAFWSTDTSKKTTGSTELSEEPGQLAVTGEPSQIHPEPAKTAIVEERKKGKSAKRERPVSAEVDKTVQKATQIEASNSKASSSTVPAKASPPNLLIPSVKSTYKLAESPGIMQKLARLFMHGHQQHGKHIFLVKDPPKIKNALAIGIHGLFPAAILRTVIGQPTGTSIRFANHAASAIRRWTDKNGSIDCEIEKVALEGEGRIGDRVDNLWKLLLNWIDHIRKADFILIACHSQGVPVALTLVAKLIEFGVVSTGRIGVCAMAGVSLGPFPEYKSKFFSGSAAELFEFADPESVVSKQYENALRVAMHYGVRVTYCGSIDDQLVSMESAIFAPVSHPYIYRVVFVDGRIHAPDFLSHLVGFALKLRNLGVPDHGLIRELSAPLAGSLYTGGGHSRLYDDGNVYDLAIEFALETTSVASDIPLTIKKYEVPTNSNPYVLPWIMRGLLEEDFVKTELDHETTDLLKQFDDWKPTTKVLKDVKYRLEAVRSKL